MNVAGGRTPNPFSAPGQWPGWVVWLAAWLLMAGLDGRVELANQALLLVLASAVAALWLPPLTSIAACALAVLAFNVAFVPPRGTLAVDLHQHGVLLATVLAVGAIVTGLMARQRRLTAAEHAHSLRADQLRRLGEALRAGDDPREHGPLLQEALSRLTGTPATVMLAAAPGEAGPETVLGAADADQATGLRLCLRHQQAMGPGTGRHEEQPAWYLPLRGRHAAFGAALLPLAMPPADAPPLREHAQALCDQMGLALERAVEAHAAANAREAARSQALRNTLLTAISHDHRTPLATILGAASSLHDQSDRLSPEQRRRLAATIVEEATQLARLTDNTLQLARLDAPGLALSLDWESAEEIIGSVLRRVRQRDPAQRVKARIEHGLPLLRCDAVLLVQLLDNLVDNALKHGGDEAPVEIVARLIGGRVVLAVRDRGPGVPPAWRERIFDVFQRGQDAPAPADAADAAAGAERDPARRGAGVGLAVCRAIARAHGGELTLRPRGHGGSSFELALPIAVPPPAAPEPGPETPG